MSEQFISIEASNDPADISLADWTAIQRLHLNGDEYGVLRLVQDIHRRAYERGLEAATQ